MSTLRRISLLAILVAALAPGSASASISVIQNGNYAGHDAAGHSITFEYAYDSLVNFHRGGSYFIAQATVTNASFEKTEGHHHVKASWVDAHTVRGTISFLVQTSRGYTLHTVTFSATRTTPTHLIIPYVGSYSGTDSHNRTVRFSFDGIDVRHLTLSGTTILNQGYAGGGSLNTSQNGTHVTARWETDHRVVGTISRNGATSSFTANAVAT